jgi:hypothetical protein
MKASINSLNEKTLIAEQPGIIVMFVGFMMVLFFGLGLRSFLAPEKIKDLVEKAATKVHREAQFQIGSAYLSLSDGAFPELAVIIKNIKIEANKECWLSPFAEINEMRLPLSFISLLKGQVRVSQVEADYVNVMLRGRLSDCHKEKKDESQNTSETAETRESKSEEDKSPLEMSLNAPPSSKKALNQVIDNLKINRLRLSYLPSAHVSAEILDFDVRLKSLSPKLVVIKGKINLGGESVLGDYVSHSIFEIEYNEEASAHWKGLMSGNLREGHFDFKMDYKIAEDSLQTDLNLKHLPIGQLAPLLNKYGVFSTDLNGKQVWFSAHGNYAGPLKEANKQPLTLSDLRLEGDIGEVEVSKVELKSLDPLVYNPISVQLKQVNISKLLTFFNRPHPSKSLGDLGIFQGEALISSANKMIVKGEYKGLEFIFANKGRREVQAISSIKGELKLDNHEWNFDVDILRPADGSFSGDLTIVASQDWRNLKMNLEIDELGFSKPVQNLMTNGGQMGLLKGNAKMVFTKGELTSVNGEFKMDNISVEGVSLEKFKTRIHTEGDVLSLNTSLQKISVGLDSGAYRLMRPVLSKFEVKDEAVDLKNIDSVMKTKMLKDFYWESFTAYNGKTKLSTRGGYDEAGLVSGNLTISHPAQKWFLRGFRENPELLFDSSETKK